LFKLENFESTIFARI